MPTKPQDKPSKVPPTPPKVNSIDGVIADQVVKSLGQPGNIHTTQVRFLWENHYRVNVFVGSEVGTAVVAHSFFLVTNAEGLILQSTPKLAKSA